MSNVWSTQREQLLFVCNFPTSMFFCRCTEKEKNPPQKSSLTPFYKVFYRQFNLLNAF